MLVVLRFGRVVELPRFMIIMSCEWMHFAFRIADFCITSINITTATTVMTTVDINKLVPPLPPSPLPSRPSADYRGGADASNHPVGSRPFHILPNVVMSPHRCVHAVAAVEPVGRRYRFAICVYYNISIAYAYIFP